MSSKSGKPIYFLLNMDGLTIFDIKFSAFAPTTDSVLLGGMVHAISTFSENVIMDGSIRGESGKLNVIEQHGRKIMFERGSEVEGILVVEEESILLMEKIRTVIDLFEHNVLPTIKEEGLIHSHEYSSFQNLTRKFIVSQTEENVVFRYSKQKNPLFQNFKIPDKWETLYNSFDGVRSIVEISRQKRWPLPYVLARAAMFLQLGFLTPADVSIKDTDIFQIQNDYIGILLEQGGAYQMINNTWGNWGVNIASHIDGKHTMASLSTRFANSEQDQKQLIQFFRWLSLRGYISLLSDTKLLLMVFEEFMSILRQRFVILFGNYLGYELFEEIFHQESIQVSKANKVFSIGKLVENHENSFHFEKLHMIMNSRQEVMTPLFQQAFLPFLDCVLRVLSSLIGRKAATEMLQQVIIDTEQEYGSLVYDILFVGDE